jgi:hypothetical protein
MVLNVVAVLGRKIIRPEERVLPVVFALMDAEIRTGSQRQCVRSCPLGVSASNGGWLVEEEFLELIRSLGRRGVFVDVGAHLGTATVWFGALCPSTLVLGHARGMVMNHLGKEHQIGFGGVAVLKLDVEGMEADVLRGASRILDWHRLIIYAEAWNITPIARIENVLRHFGYEATGRAFNATPTYEFIAPSCAGASACAHSGGGCPRRSASEYGPARSAAASRKARLATMAGSSLTHDLLPHPARSSAKR